MDGYTVTYDGGPVCLFFSLIRQAPGTFLEVLIFNLLSHGDYHVRLHANFGRFQSQQSNNCNFVWSLILSISMFAALPCTESCGQKQSNDRTAGYTQHEHRGMNRIPHALSAGPHVAAWMTCRLYQSGKERGAFQVEDERPVFGYDASNHTLRCDTICKSIATHYAGV